MYMKSTLSLRIIERLIHKITGGNYCMDKKKITRGDIYYADLNPVIGSEQGDCRPVIVVQNDTGNAHSPTVVIVPLTRNLRKNRLPTHVLIPKHCGLGRASLMLGEQIRTVDRSRLSAYIGHISKGVQPIVDKALAVCVGLEKRRPQKGEMLELYLCSQCESDFKRSGYLLIRKGLHDIYNNCDFFKIEKGLNFGIFNLDKVRGEQQYGN
jgi:mRNA interferase MazF